MVYTPGGHQRPPSNGRAMNPALLEQALVGAHQENDALRAENRRVLTLLMTVVAHAGGRVRLPGPYRLDAEAALKAVADEQTGELVLSVEGVTVGAVVLPEAESFAEGAEAGEPPPEPPVEASDG